MVTGVLTTSEGVPAGITGVLARSAVVPPRITEVLSRFVGASLGLREC